MVHHGAPIHGAWRRAFNNSRMGKVVAEPGETPRQVRGISNSELRIADVKSEFRDSEFEILFSRDTVLACDGLYGRAFAPSAPVAALSSQPSRL